METYTEFDSHNGVVWVTQYYYANGTKYRKDWSAKLADFKIVSDKEANELSDRYSAVV